MPKLSSSKFCHSTQISADALISIVVLLWKLPQMPSSAQTTPTWTKPILTCFTKVIAVQPSMAEYEWTMYQIKEDYSCYHALKSVLLYFFQFEKLGVKPGFPITQLNQATYSKLGKKSNIDMFHKNDCWAVICYPICMNHVSYEED